jgi:hypothetical protein
MAYINTAFIRLGMRRLTEYKGVDQLILFYKMINEGQVNEMAMPGVKFYEMPSHVLSQNH